MNFDIITPLDWRRASISKYCHVQLGKMLQSDPSDYKDALLPYLRAISISKNGVDLSHQFAMWIKPHEKEKFRLKRDDVLVSEGGDAGRTAYFDSDGEYYFQNAINRVRPIDDKLITSRYLFYWFTFLKLAGYVDLVCNVATIAHFTAEKVKAAPLAFPSLETQRRIAAFLDEKTAQIDGLIAKKQALLDQLAEKRQAIITQAVTKGLKPASPMKHSGIDWLGQIPAHWQVLSFGRSISRIEQGWSPQCEERQKDEAEWGVLRSGCVNEVSFDQATIKPFLSISILDHSWKFALAICRSLPRSLRTRSPGSAPRMPASSTRATGTGVRRMPRAPSSLNSSRSKKI